MTDALVLVDVINDFFHAEGANYHPEYDPILESIRHVLDTARKHGVRVVHTMEGHPPGHEQDFEWEKLPHHCVLGSFAAEPADGIQIQEGEYEVRKRRFSAFMATDLDLLLRELRVTRVFIVGVKTHVCVRATVEDAFAYGYDVHVIREAVGSNYPNLNAASLEDIERYMGTVISLEECVRVFEQESQSAEKP